MTTQSESLAGIWKGSRNFENRGITKEQVTLTISQNGPNLSGVMTEEYFFRGKRSIINQTFIGSIQGRAITLTGINYTYIEQGNTTTYSPERNELTLAPDGKQMTGRGFDHLGSYAVSYQKVGNASSVPPNIDIFVRESAESRNTSSKVYYSGDTCPFCNGLIPLTHVLTNLKCPSCRGVFEPVNCGADILPPPRAGLPPLPRHWLEYRCSSCGQRKRAIDQCFIATQVYGSTQALEVVILRSWRDGHLSKSEIGRAFIRAYYSWLGPFAARIVSSNRIAAVLARFVLNQTVQVIQRRGTQKDLS